jgi:hypothetical protein
MFDQRTVSDYYRAALAELTTVVESTPDDRVLGMNEGEWIDYLVRKYTMQTIEFDASRSAEMTETEVKYTLRRDDFFTGRQAGTTVVETRVRVSVPVVPSDTLSEIWRHGLAPNSFHLVKYPEYDYDDTRGIISGVVDPSPSAVNGLIKAMEDSIQRYNASITDENRTFRAKVQPVVEAKRRRVTEKHSKLDTLAAAVGIPLTKKNEPSKVVPTAVRVKKSVAVAMPLANHRPERPVLETTTFNALLELIDNQCRQFERTPQAFSELSEEGLRDVMLSSLNSVFQGAATGETFRGIGKVDIHLQIDRGDVFVAELKFWDGTKSLEETITQLRQRLTWRDSRGVAIMLSRNRGFSEVAKSIEQTLPNVVGFTAGTLRKRADNHFVARFSIPSDALRQAEITIFVYNLYVDQPARRQARRKSSSARDGSSE